MIEHVAVMTEQVIENMAISKNGTYLDATFGHGGHSGLILEAGAGQLFALDRDEQAFREYQKEGKYREAPNLTFIHSSFAQADEHFAPASLDGILLDLGPSTRQLLDGDRGFSFINQGPLDMRMDRSRGETLEQMLHRLSEQELEIALRPYLRGAKKIAAKLKTAFMENTISNTLELAALMGEKRGPRHPATNLFSALRILVNQEFDQIEQGIPRLIPLLKPGGRLVVITFHSDEDRLVKYLFKHLAGKPAGALAGLEQPLIRWVHKKTIKPEREEVLNNPRSRSAKVRCVEKL